MWIEAIVSQEDFTGLAAELLPVRVHLGQADSDHYLFLSAAREVSLVEGKGLRVTCNAQIRWPVLGIDIPINIDALTVLLEPSIAQEGEALELGLRIEHADVAWVPAILDEKIVDTVNQALTKKSAELSWNFSKALSQDFVLPAMLQPLLALGLKAGWGKIRTTHEAMVLVISFHAHTVRQDSTRVVSAASARPAITEKRRAPADTAPRRSTSPATTIVATAALALTTFWVARGTYRLFASQGRVY